MSMSLKDFNKPLPLNESQRIKYFLLACIPSRLILASIPLLLTKYNINTKYYAIITLPIALAFLYLYFANGRMNASEGGGITWWSDYRLIHGMLFLTASIFLLDNNNLSSLVLLVDTLIGLGAFVNKHFM